MELASNAAWLGNVANAINKGSIDTREGVNGGTRLEEGAASTRNLFAVCARGGEGTRVEE